MSMEDYSEERLLAKACNGVYRVNAVRAIRILDDRGYIYTRQQARAIKNRWNITVEGGRGSNAEKRSASFRRDTNTGSGTRRRH